MINFFSPRFSKRTLLVLLITLLLIGSGLWLSRYFEWKEEEIDLGQSDSASKNQFLAAQKFLARQGVAAQTLRSFSVIDTMNWQGEMLTTDDTLVLLNAHKLLHGQRLETLLDWVAQGGTVIASTDNPYIGTNTDTQDLLFEHFELEAVRRENESTEDDSGSDEQDEKQEKANGVNDTDAEQSKIAEPASEASANELSDEEKIAADISLRCEFFSEIVDVEFAQENDMLQIDYSAGNYFDFYGEEPEHWSGSDDGVYLAIFRWGSGRVIVNSDNHIWSNRRIDCHDHAYALWKLVNPDGKVWFLVNQEAPSLWALLWRASPYGALAALLALALWLWAKASRFGPILPHQAVGRRSLGEHIHASAALLWRRQQHPYLVTLLRVELRQKLQQHLPQFDSLSRNEQITHLQILTTLGADELEKALFSEQLQSPQEFTTAVGYLQLIRKNL